MGYHFCLITPSVPTAPGHQIRWSRFLKSNLLWWRNHFVTRLPSIEVRFFGTQDGVVMAGGETLVPHC